jgi:hypothetical protein
MTSPREQSNELFNRFDFLVIIGAVVALFVALGSEPWWTLNGTTTSKLFSVEVSPFFVHIVAVGLPSTVPFANSLGGFTRTFLLVGFIMLFAAGLRPTAWWRNLAVYFGISSLAELYLSFLLMYYWAETAFFNVYGVVLPLSGTATLAANVVGLDFAYYASPLVTASFGLPYYIGFLSIGLVVGRAVIRILHARAFQVLAALVPGGAIHDISLTPPYQRVWFSNTDDQYNPVRRYLGGAGDDQLLVSFEKLFETVEPGGSLSVVLPEGATVLTDKLEKMMPEIGFAIEETRAITSPQGKPEIELRFRRPAAEQAPTREDPSTEQSSILETPAAEPTLAREPIPSPETPENAPGVLPAQEPAASLLEEAASILAEVPVEKESPPMLEMVQQSLVPGQRKMTRLERTMLKSATRIINEHHQTVPYRELLNEVYMDLVDQRVEFDSARQIETTLQSHNGQEIVLVEESDGPGGRIVKKWGLGKQKLRSERSHRIPVLNRVRAVTPKITSIRKIIRKPRKSRYVRVKENEDDGSSQLPES